MCACVHKVRGSEYIVADNNGNAYWSEVILTSSTKYSINKKVLIVYVEYLIDNINACTNAHSNCLCVLPTLNMPSQFHSWVWGVIVACGDIGGPRSQALGSNSSQL